MKTAKKILILIIITVFLISLNSIVYSAGSYSVTASSKSLAPGKTATLTIKTTNAVGRFNITSSNPGVVTVGKSSVWVSSSENITLTAKTAGTATITVTPEDVSDTEYNKITSPKSVIITVGANNTTTPNQPTNPTTPSQPNNTKSGDATLKSITIGGKTYSGSSLKNTISYTVESSVNSIKISAIKNHSKATVSGTGTKSLVAGQTNKFPINVTAENGTKKTYNVNIIRLADDETIPNIIDEENQIPDTQETKPKLTSLIIKDVELNPEFNPEIYSYTTNVKNIKELEIDATANIADAKIDIEGATELTQGDNIVKITVTLGEEKTVYIIDLYNEIEEEIVGMTNDSDNKQDNGNNNFIAGNLKEILSILMICSLGIIAIRYIILSYMLSKELDESSDEDLIIEDDIEDKGLKVKNQNIAIETGRIGRHF
ncbi:MAG: hypothetical protein HFJ19_02835 [Clostridia bacterium]|nr:hypothetical protein [Clostridia bacterium]